MVPTSASLIRRDERMAALEREVRGIHHYGINRAQMAIEEARIRVRKNFWRSSKGRSIIGLCLFVLGCLAGAAVSQTGMIDDAVLGARQSLIKLLQPGNDGNHGEVASKVPTPAAAVVNEVVVPAFPVDAGQATVAPAEIEVGAPMIPTPIADLGSVSTKPRPPAVRLKAESASAGSSPQEGIIEEEAVATDLSAAVEKARERMNASGAAKPASRPATPETGVSVVLPDRSATTKRADEPPVQAAQNEPKDSSAFSVVRYMENSLLVRSGPQVKTIRVGETLPNGQKLISVDPKTQAFNSQ
ncbi:hypothetical protein [Hydrogenophaga sp. NFH-34]|uniref:hypothetical protein n=1 Tax=Hydrogenophaga sp. NFH-34 TaxID=2744446 RepID=UPI001F224578|nr:hypothetical protein [Hydrogenophaga sp. NFH-34]